MNALSSPAITMHHGEIVVDADLLAPNLGLSTELLRDGMRKAIVYGGAETGVNEDAGRTRLTFGYRTRAWTVVVEAGGTLVESIAPAAKASLANTDHPSLLDFDGPEP